MKFLQSTNCLQYYYLCDPCAANAAAAAVVVFVAAVVDIVVVVAVVVVVAAAAAAANKIRHRRIRECWCHGLWWVLWRWLLLQQQQQISWFIGLIIFLLQQKKRWNGVQCIWLVWNLLWNHMFVTTNPNCHRLWIEFTRETKLILKSGCYQYHTFPKNILLIFVIHYHYIPWQLNLD